MDSTKFIVPFILIAFIALYTACDNPASLDSRLDTEFVIFQNSEKGSTDKQISNLVEANVLHESQIKFSYYKKISGFSATLSQSQIDLLNSGKHEDSSIIPGEFIIVFIDPFNGEKYTTEEGNQWAMMTIENLQYKYGISDEQVLSRYGYANFGFAAELSDEQLYKLEGEELINYIVPNVLVSLY